MAWVRGSWTRATSSSYWGRYLTQRVWSSMAWSKVRSRGRMLTTWVESGGSWVSSTTGVSWGGGGGGGGGRGRGRARCTGRGRGRGRRGGGGRCRRRGRCGRSGPGGRRR